MRSLAAVGLLVAGCAPTFVRPPADEVCVPPESGFFGRVLLGDTDTPVAGVQVSTEPTTGVALTDRNGCFRIEPDEDVPAGRYALVLRPRLGDTKVRDVAVDLAVPDDFAFVYDGDTIWLGRRTLQEQAKPEDTTPGGSTPEDQHKKPGQIISG